MTTSTLIFRQLSIEEIKELSLQAPTTEQSIQQAKENANRLWLEAARRIVYDLCASRREFTSDDKRFWSRVKIGKGCWNWVGYKGRCGYGHFWANGKTVKASRWMFQRYIGKLNASKPLVLHSCDNRACVNPAHLRAGTHAENMQDRNVRGRQARLRGEDNGNSQISDKTAEKILAMRRKGFTLKKVGKKFGVSYQTVYRIDKGMRHKAGTGNNIAA